MKNNYYCEVENYIKKNEVNKKARILEENSDTLQNFWNIGRLIVEAQGGEARAEYGNNLIKQWSNLYTKKYGKGYNNSNLKRFRQFYLLFQKGATVSHLSWSQVVQLLPIKDENKRNYYINLCIKNNLSVRELRYEIKNNSYDRLINKPSKIEIISFKEKINIKNDLKNPIIIELNENQQITKESDLELAILSQLKNFFNQLGNGFTFVDNQYKLAYNNINYYIDILLFNYKLNCFIVVELKLRGLKKEDKAQIEFYMNLVDEQIKESYHNKTIGIIISKKQDKFIAEFVGSNEIIPLTYQTVSK